MKITEENLTNISRFGPSSICNRVAMSVTGLCGSLPLAGVGRPTLHGANPN